MVETIATTVGIVVAVVTVAGVFTKWLKSDISELRADNREMRTEMRADNAAVRADIHKLDERLSGDHREMRTELRADNAALETRLTANVDRILDRLPKP